MERGVDQNFQTILSQLIVPEDIKDHSAGNSGAYRKIIENGSIEDKLDIATLKTVKMNRCQIAIIFFLTLSIFSCDKNETEVRTGILGKWKATEFMSVESVAYPKKDGYNPVIEFNNDGTYYLKLDMNSCIGIFTLTDNSGISMTAPGCTKICCDSEFSKKFVEFNSFLSRISL